MMRAYIVTVVDAYRRKRTRIPMIAENWHQCWTEAINTFGLAVVISVRPAK